jgi:lipopolysaccharide biosynthesis glycosyltransferase
LNPIIHIAFAVYDKSGTYIRHTAAAMLSVFTNTYSPIHIHLLHDTTLTTENKIKLNALCLQYKQQISFHQIDLSIDEKLYPSLRDFSIGTLFRLKIMEIFPDLDKIIYLDNDIICTIDIKNLWNENIENTSMGVVADPCTHVLDTIPAERLVFYQKVPIMNASYFNAGILYLNLKHLRLHNYNLFNDSLNFLNEHPNSSVPDQDALNFLFQKSCTFLSEKYNRLVPYYTQDYQDEATWQNAIWHFAGHKPWETRSSRLDNLYWHYLRLTPWCEDFDLGMLYDCFTYNGEFELLDLRLNLLYDLVDYFVIIESNNTCLPKESLHIKDLFPRYSDKIICLNIAAPPHYDKNIQQLKALSQNCLMSVLSSCQPNDLILLSDIKEIPNPWLLKKISALRNLIIKTPLIFEQDCYSNYINWSTSEKRLGTILTRYKNMQSPEHLYQQRNALPCISNGGWHFSHLGAPLSVMDSVIPVQAEEIGIDIMPTFLEAYPYLYKK